VRSAYSSAKLLLSLGACLAVVGRAEAAPPIGVILSDIDAPAEQRELAGSLGLLIRSMLGPGQRGLVPARELSLALEVLNSGRRNEALIVDPIQAKPLMERLGADRTFLGRLTVDETRWEVRGPVLGPEGDRLSSVSVQVPPGELNELARQIAQRLALRLGLTALERQPVSLDSLRPYARAQAQMNSGDPRGAATTLQLADPRAGTQVSAAKEMVESLAANAAVSQPARMQMSLLAGDNQTAKQSAEEILKAEPGNVQARAGKVRAMAGMGDLQNAIHEFEPIKSAKDPFSATANVALLVKRRYSPDRKGLGGQPTEEDQTAALAASLSDPEDDAKPTLAFMSGANPNALPPEVETAAVGAAERVADKDPALAASVATRALNGGVEVERALPLAKPAKMEKAELAAAKEKLEAIGPKGEKASKALGQELDKRAGAAEKLRLGGLDVQPTDIALEPLAAELRRLLSNFGILQEQIGQRVLILAKQQTEATWHLPFQVRRRRLEHGLWRSAFEKPFEMSLVAPTAGADTLATSNLTEPYLGTLVDQRGVDLVLVHSSQTSGLDVNVELILFDGASATAYRTSGKVAGMGSNKLLGMNVVPFVLLGVLVLVPIVILRLRRRVGEVTVRVAAADAVERRLCLLLSQSAKPPRVPDPKAYAEEFDRNSRSKVKFFARVTEASITFERVPPGRWFAHLYGTYKTGKISHTISGDEFTQVVEVKQQEIAPVSFSLTVSNAEFHVTVQDKSRPQVGVPVWIDNDRDRAVKTNEDGLAVLKVGMGQRVLRVEAGGMLIEKNHVVVKRKAHVIAINLDWERKVDDVSRALDNDPEVVAARTISATMPAQTSSATLPAQTSSATLPAQKKERPDSIELGPDPDAIDIGGGGDGEPAPRPKQQEDSIDIGLDLPPMEEAPPKAPAAAGPPVDAVSIPPEFLPPPEESI
jgi:hypothetical protein